jgi:hypothetical protein
MKLRLQQQDMRGPKAANPCEACDMFCTWTCACLPLFALAILAHRVFESSSVLVWSADSVC